MHAIRVQVYLRNLVRHAAEQAADVIRENILAGRIPAGARIAELDVARQLSVSRTPIREALSRLAAEGLVELSPNRGARVTSWTPDELREIFEVRLRLEPYAVRQAVPRLTSAQLDDLSGLAQSMLREGRPGAGQDLAAVVDLNRRFHGLLVAMARNAPLAGALTAVTHAAVVHQNFQHYGPGALARSLAHHAEIVAAARAQEPDWAEAVMRSHLYNARATMLDQAEVTP
ncbi:MAG: GntR family transcriptional regulator [Streptosporangiaceae bacterium]